MFPSGGSAEGWENVFLKRSKAPLSLVFICELNQQQNKEHTIKMKRGEEKKMRGERETTGGLFPNSLRLDASVS